jgi:hypothetical protein
MDNPLQFRLLFYVSTIVDAFIESFLTHDCSPGDQPSSNCHAVLLSVGTHEQQHGTNDDYDQLEPIHLSSAQHICRESKSYLADHCARKR